MKHLTFLILLLALVSPARARETVITILHTNDMHGRVLSTSYDTDAGPGGLARIATLVNDIRRHTSGTILLDAGDAVQGTPTEFITQGESILTAMNALRYDAATLGNHEFDWSQTVTSLNAMRADFPFLSANVLDRMTGKPYGGARAYTIVKRGPIRVAVFGLTTLQTPQIEWPRAIDRIRFADPTPIARALVPRLRKMADIVVCLSHLGYEQDKQLARAVPGIDIIVGGHSHTTLRERVTVGKCVIAQAGALAANLGRIDVRMAEHGKAWHIASVNGEGGKWWAAPWPQTPLIAVSESVERDQAVTSGYLAAWNEAKDLLAETLGAAAEDIPARDSKDRRPCTLLLADLLRQAVRSDVALMPADYGPYIPAGPITNSTLFNIIGGFTRQNVVTVRASGAALRSAVEGAQITVARKPQVQFAGIGGVIHYGDGKPEWLNATVGGQPLDEAALYTVASGAYPIMEFPSLMESPLVSDRLGWLKPLLASAIRERKVLTPVKPTLAIEQTSVASP